MARGEVRGEARGEAKALDNAEAILAGLMAGQPPAAIANELNVKLEVVLRLAQTIGKA